MKKFALLIALLAIVPFASAGIVFVAPDSVNSGSTFTVELWADGGESVTGGALGLISDNGAGGLMTPGSWADGFTVSNDGGYLGSGFGFTDGDLLAATATAGVGVPVTGLLYSFQYTVANDFTGLIDFSVSDLAAFGITTGISTATDSFVPAGFQVNVVPEPMTMALLGLGGLFIRRRRA